MNNTKAYIIIDESMDRSFTISAGIYNDKLYHCIIGLVPWIYFGLYTYTSLNMASLL